MQQLRKTKIVATIGPASESLEMMVKLFEAGVNVARLNFSHGTQEEQGERILRIREAAKIVGRPIAILIDLKGPEIRLGTFATGKIMLKEGDRFTLTTQQVEGDQSKVWVQYPEIVKDVKVGGYLLLDDGNITLKALEVTETEVHCEVIVGGPLSNRKKVNLPGTKVSLPALAEKDVSDIQFGVKMGVDFVAGSFIRKAADVVEIRKIIEEAGGNQQIIAKIESQEGFDELEAILAVSDGLMVARGDLGVEVPTEEVPLMQKHMIARCNQLGKPVITATQMLESMITKPRPTRAEASDVANAILDGTDAIMLSAESAAGDYPVEAVKTMVHIALRTERGINYAELLDKKRKMAHLDTVTEAISHATATTAADLGAAAIITATRSGFTARQVSRFRPACPIIAVTPDESAARKLQLVNGVYTVTQPESPDTDALINDAIAGALAAGYIHDGDLVVITAGVPVGVTGTTNLLKVHTVADALLKGTGVGRAAATGPVRIITSANDIASVQEGDILVLRSTDAEHVPVIEKAAGLITEEGGITSHAAVVGLSLGKPVIVGAAGAIGNLRNGDVVTLDPASGRVLRGKANVR
jgi:pyruvate kinase